jgi:hypothetical protein
MDLRMGKGVQEVIVIQRGRCDRTRAVRLYQKGKKRKRKGTWELNQVGKVVRTLIASQRASADDYVRRHDASSREKEDGWIRDLPYNVYRAARRGARKLRAVSPLPVFGSD